MSRNSTRIHVAKLVFYTIASDRLTTLNCRHCRSPLDIHQPNPNQPDQFLGTCPKCDRWFRVGVNLGEGRALVVLLPEVAEMDTTASPSDVPC